MRTPPARPHGSQPRPHSRVRCPEHSHCAPFCWYSWCLLSTLSLRISPHAHKRSWLRAAYIPSPFDGLTGQVLTQSRGSSQIPSKSGSSKAVASSDIWLLFFGELSTAGLRAVCPGNMHCLKSHLWAQTRLRRMVRINCSGSPIYPFARQGVRCSRCMA